MLPKHLKAPVANDFIAGPTKVSGVRVYTPATDSVASGELIFFSRRGEGPYYRWLFEKQSGRWRAARVIDPVSDCHSLFQTTWKTLPEALATRLGEHYLE